MLTLMPPLFHVKILWVVAWFKTLIRKSLFRDSARCRNADKHASGCRQLQSSYPLGSDKAVNVLETWLCLALIEVDENVIRCRRVAAACS